MRVKLASFRKKSAESVVLFERKFMWQSKNILYKCHVT